MQQCEALLCVLMLLVHVLELSEFVDFKLKILQTPMRPLLEHCCGRCER